MADATRERDDAVVCEHVAEERIDRRVVDVGGEDPLLEIVEDDRLRHAAEAMKRLRVRWTAGSRALLALPPKDSDAAGVASPSNGARNGNGLDHEGAGLSVPPGFSPSAPSSPRHLPAEVEVDRIPELVGEVERLR